MLCNASAAQFGVPGDASGIAVDAPMRAFSRDRVSSLCLPCFSDAPVWGAPGAGNAFKSVIMPHDAKCLSCSVKDVGGGRVTSVSGPVEIFFTHAGIFADSGFFDVLPEVLYGFFMQGIGREGEDDFLELARLPERVEGLCGRGWWIEGWMMSTGASRSGDIQDGRQDGGKAAAEQARFRGE